MFRTVITGEDNQRIARHVQLFEPFQEAPDVIVEHGDTAKVARHFTRLGPSALDIGATEFQLPGRQLGFPVPIHLQEALGGDNRNMRLTEPQENTEGCPAVPLVVKPVDGLVDDHLRHPSRLPPQFSPVADETGRILTEVALVGEPVTEADVTRVRVGRISENSAAVPLAGEHGLVARFVQ